MKPQVYRVPCVDHGGGDFIAVSVEHGRGNHHRADLVHEKAIGNDRLAGYGVGAGIDATSGRYGYPAGAAECADH